MSRSRVNWELKLSKSSYGRGVKSGQGIRFEPNLNDCFMNNGKMMKTHLIEENTIACFAHP